MSKNRLKKGFTIIELIVVIAILGILVLLAVPKFLGYTTDAKVANVKNDIAAYENAIEKERIDDDKYIKNWEKVDVAKMNSLKNSLFTKKGLITESNNVAFGGEYYKIPEDSKLIKTSLKGDFYLGQGGEVYYYDEKLASKVLGKSSAIEPEPPAPIETFKVTFKDYYGQTIEEKTVEKGQAVTAPVNPVTGLEIDKWNKDLTNITSDLEVKPVVDGPTDKELGYSKDDFSWNAGSLGQIGLNGEKGYFKYTGTGRSTVEIPHVIQGVPMTSYYSMFFESPAEAYKVVSTNKNVTSMSAMFYNSKATSLDLSELDTSKVTSMSSMFNGSQAGSLDLSTFDTSKVTNMDFMFRNSQATSLDLSNFDTSKVTNMYAMFANLQATSIKFGPKFNTSNVTDMRSMFNNSKAESLDVSNFDTSKVADMNGMFQNSQATSITFGPKFNTSKVTNMYAMFRKSQASTLDLSSFDTSKVTNMYAMFSSSKATSLDVSSFNTSNVTDMKSMFAGSQATSLTFGPKFNTSNITDMSLMFAGSQATSLDLSSFNTSKVENMSWMFDKSKATEGYARTEADAKKFNASFGKPAALTFEVKNP